MVSLTRSAGATAAAKSPRSHSPATVWPLCGSVGSSLVSFSLTIGFAAGPTGGWN